MEISDTTAGSHSAPSPCGRYVASVANSKLRICASSAPERYTDVNIRAVKDVIALRWSEDSNNVAVLSAQHVEVVVLDDSSHRVRIDNGSAGLGRFTSVDFVGLDQLLVVWEFGKAKLWNLTDGKAAELADVKHTGAGSAWQMRPGNGNPSTRALAVLSRNGSEDVLNVYFPALHKQLSSTKMSTIDAQSISWSPDGRWLAVVDTPTTTPSVHIFTPDGHLFRTCPAASETSSSSLSVKSATWSSSSLFLALAKHDGRITLLNTKTFAPLAIIEHSTTIDQRALPSEKQATIWQQRVSASGERSYNKATHPVSPPLSRTKPSSEPSELGVAETRANFDGSYLATRDERMLNTVWVWDMSAPAAYAVLVQHSNVRRLRWHPTRSELLMLDCAEGIAYLFDTSSSQPPVPISTSVPGAPILSWIHTAAQSRPALLSATKSSFRVVYPEGVPESYDLRDSQAVAGEAAENEPFDEGESEDSLFDVLSGRKPMPLKTEPSHTEMVDLEIETEEEDMTLRVDDTFREKKKSRKQTLVDPLDDSEIF